MYGLVERDAGALRLLRLDLQQRLSQLGLGVVLGPLGVVPADLLPVDLGREGSLAGLKSRECRRRRTRHVVALGRRGRLKGGKARTANLTDTQRCELARKAGRARWGKPKKG